MDVTEHTAEPVLRRLTAPTLLDLAADSIRDSILSGRLEMGARLVDSRLAVDLGISRGTVRGALTRLVDEGLVVDQARQGYFVSDFGAQDLIDLCNLRVGLEPIAAELCCRRRADLSGLEDILKEMQDAVDGGDPAVVNRAERAFHAEVVALSGNRHLVDLYGAVRNRMRMVQMLDSRANGPSYDGLIDRHVLLLEALRSGDGRRAHRAAHEHVVAPAGEVLRRLGEDTSQLLPPF